jgi:hypothetical protein
VPKKFTNYRHRKKKHRDKERARESESERMREIRERVRSRTLAGVRSALTLYPPRLLTTHVNMASRPCGIVMFSSGYRKSGSKPRAAEHRHKRFIL